MAEVFKAKAHGVEGFEKILVIKRILNELSENPDFVEMFINEAKIAVTLSHANIVQVFDLGRADDTYFIAMEYVAGSDLATVLRRARKYGKPLPAELAVYVVSEVAKGLDYAHRRRDAEMQPMRIVHRDVSPQNVLLSFEGEVKLTDFGIAKARTTVPTGTEAGVLKGKYAYMSPEQARGKDVDARTDIFALGVVLYEALSGQNPFLQPSTYDTLQVVREGKAAPIESVAEVPDELAAIVGQAMHPDPDERHANAGLFYEDLIQYLYASGRRAGAHDLSNYLDQLRAIAEGRKKGKQTMELRASFELDTAVGREPHERTPAESPSARNTSGVSTSATGQPTGVARPQVERRDVTVLATSAEVAGASAQIRERVERAGGEVLSADGDAVIALFGRTRPDGRDGEAAARVALGILTDHPQWRCALHGGRALVDVKGKLLDEDPDRDALVAEVEALLSAAEPGWARTSESVRRAIRRYFDLRPARLSKGGDDESGWDLVGERDLVESPTRFVGRREELRAIGEVLGAAHKGQQSVLSVVGDAGSGKSRLIAETVRRLRENNHNAAVHVCHVPPPSAAVPLSAIEEIVKAVLGVEEFDDDDARRNKAARLRELGLTQAESDAIGQLIGLQVEQHISRRQMRIALQRMAGKLAEDRLTVFFFDDFDHVDVESLGLIQEIVGRPGASRILVALAYRDESAFTFDDVPHHTVVRLTPLADADVARLLAARLGVDEVSLELLREVTLKSAGNPLYVEEHLLALQDAGAIDVEGDEVRFRPDVAVEVPRSLRGIVSARLAKLDAEDRHLLQIASLVGGRFHDVLVARVADVELEPAQRRLEELVVRGILVHTGAQEFGFSHHLIPQVVQSGLPLEAQQRIHSAIGHAFEGIYPKHLDDLSERLAFHFREAGNRDRAIDYLVRAANRMETEQNPAGAIALLDRALTLLSTGAAQSRDRMLELFARLADLVLLGRELEKGLELMERALELAENLGRERLVVRFCLVRAECLQLLNRFSDATPWYERARTVAKRVNDPDLLRDVTTAWATAHSRNGEYGRAITLLTEALELARQAQDPVAQRRCLLPLAHAYGGNDDRDGAVAAIEEARKLAEQSSDRIVEIELLKTESLVAYYIGDLPGAASTAHRALELAKEWGFPYEAAVNAHNLGETYLLLGDYKRAFAMLRYSYDVSRDHGFVKLQFGNMRVLGFIDAIKLGSAEGRQRILEAYEYALEHHYVWDVVQSRYMLAVVDYTQGRVDEGKLGLREVLLLSREYGMRHYEKLAEVAIDAAGRGAPIPLRV